MTTATRQRTLIVMDPVECGADAFGRALARLDPAEHEVTLTVLATSPPGSESHSPSVEGVAPAFEYADRALTGHMDRARSMGFLVDGWVAPRRRSRIEEETRARGEFNHVLAVSPSGAWLRIRGADVARILTRTHSAPVEVACEN